MIKDKPNLASQSYTGKLFLFLAILIICLPALSIAATVDLPETGQTTCYDSSGNVISCPNTGQDGDTLAGVTWPSPRFTDNLNGTVTDNLTGLVWLKNANCFPERTWSLALSDCNGLANGSCGLSDGSIAGGWRLPNVNELESLVNAQQSNPATWLRTQGFTNVQSYYYWSSTSYANLIFEAWVVHMNNGNVFSNFKASTMSQKILT